MANIRVKPARAGMRLSHPTAGPLKDEGGEWPLDQFTFRRMRDGDVEEVKPESPAPAPAPAAATAPLAAPETSATPAPSKN